MERTDSQARHVGALFLHTARKTDWFGAGEHMGCVLASDLAWTWVV